MKRTLRRLVAGVFISSAALACSQLLPSEAATIKSAHYRLVWHDEFTGRARTLPDPHKWRTIVGGDTPGQETEYDSNSPANVSLDGQGDLAITARRQSHVAGHHTWQYTSGRLVTLGRFSVQYGRIEARIKFPAGTGLWPAFFLLGRDYPRVGWPDSGEMDPMEFQGQRPTRLVATVHGPGTGRPNGWQQNAFAYSTTPFNSRFHVYGMNWRPNKIVFTLDGRTYGTVTPQDLKPGDQWVFNRPYFLLLNLAVGGFWVGAPTSTTHFPATMLVDWVRVYS